jgi:ornithine cyclodeaminase
LAHIFDLDQIKKVISTLNVTEDIEAGFIAYSQNQVVVPPVGELTFEAPPGDTHIKYGYIKDDDYFVIKIASGFYDNPKIGLSSSSGLMLLFSQKTGVLVSVLLDEGYLTNVRTAMAGEISAKYLAPKNIGCIGILGTGIQARMQVEYLKSITDCKHIIVWGRHQESLAAYKSDMEELGYEVQTTREAADVAGSCNLIVTATPATSPLLQANQIRPGTHITAMGSDTPGKQELDPEILQKADIVVADSIEQCMVRGEIHVASAAGLLKKEDIFELGNVIADKKLQRISDDQITVADLTGVAVQDIQIAKAVHEALLQSDFGDE